jgi:hypothetical protein
MANEIMSVEGQLIGMPLAGPESFSQQQLDYLKRALGVDETVLWEYDGTNPQSSVTLSEAFTNFKFLDIYEKWAGGGTNRVVIRISVDSANGFVTNMSLGNNTWYVNVQKWSVSGTSLSVASAHAIHGSSYTSTDIIHESNTDLLKKTICKVVGVGRIAGGN